MDDDPRKLSLAMRISRKTMRLVWQNIVFALAVKAVCLVLGALGIANMWVAIFADVGVMVLCVLNAAVRSIRNACDPLYRKKTACWRPFFGFAYFQVQRRKLPSVRIRAQISPSGRAMTISSDAASHDALSPRFIVPRSYTAR